MIPRATSRSGHPPGTTVVASAKMIMPKDRTLACHAWQPPSLSVQTEQRPYGCVLRFRRRMQLALTTFDIDIACSFRIAAHEAGAHQQIPTEDVIAAAGAEADGGGKNA